jgi:hypothetical protein
MIGGLLRQLLPALGRYVWYHATRVFQRKEPMAPTSAATPGVRSSADEAGLDPAYQRLVSWPCYRSDIPAEEVRSNALYQLWTTTPHGHKWSHYFHVYEAVFGSRRTLPMRILEIGVLDGSSLQLWKRYFSHPETVIVGIDIEPGCQRLDAPAEGIRVRIGSQDDGAFLTSVVQEFGPFDLVIDDGSHRSSHMIASFNHLFAEGLKTSGIYFVEDLHANYWQPWRDSRRSFLDLCKELQEHMHAHYRNAPPRAFLIDRPSDQKMAALEVPLITTMMSEIRVFDSIVAIYKTHRDHVPYYLIS